MTESPSRYAHPEHAARVTASPPVRSSLTTGSAPRPHQGAHRRATRAGALGGEGPPVNARAGGLAWAATRYSFVPEAFDESALAPGLAPQAARGLLCAECIARGTDFRVPGNKSVPLLCRWNRLGTADVEYSGHIWIFYQGRATGARGRQICMGSASAIYTQYHQNHQNKDRYISNINTLVVPGMVPTVPSYSLNGGSPHSLGAVGCDMLNVSRRVGELC